MVLGRGIRTVHYHCIFCRHDWMHVDVIPRDSFPFVRLITRD
jgi:hypothetical protein